MDEGQQREYDFFMRMAALAQQNIDDMEKCRYYGWGIQQGFVFVHRDKLPIKGAAPALLEALTEGIGIPANEGFADDLDTVANQLESGLPVYAEMIRAKAQAIRAAVAAVRGEVER